jgi:hypothetical protein
VRYALGCDTETGAQKDLCPQVNPGATQSANRFGMWARTIENRGRVQQEYLGTNLSLPKSMLSGLTPAVVPKY